MLTREVLPRLGRLLLTRLLMLLVMGTIVVMVCQLPFLAPPPDLKPSDPRYAEIRAQLPQRYVHSVTTFPQRLAESDDLHRWVGKAWAKSSLLLVAGMSLALLAGVLVGIGTAVTARRKGRGALLTATFLMLALPDFLIVVFLQRLTVILYRNFDISLFPILSDQSARGWVMPALAIGLLPAAYLSRMAAIAIDDINRQDYVRTAHAKGLHPSRVIFAHVLKNAVSRIAAYLPNAAAFAVSAMLVVEYLTNYDGLGFFVLLGWNRRELVLTVDRMTAAALALVLTYVLLDLISRAAATALRGPVTTSEAEGMV